MRVEVLWVGRVCSSSKSRKWDASRSLRWNQDAQREEDQQRMNDIVQYLTKLRLRTAGDKCEKVKQREVRLSTSYMYVPNSTLYENMYVPVHSGSAPTLCLLF